MERWIEWANFFFYMGNRIAFFGSESVTITKKIFDNNGRILVLQVKINDGIYLLLNLYNSNTKPE